MVSLSPHLPQVGGSLPELVQKIQEEVAPLVLVFKLLPRCCDGDKDAVLRRRSLNKKLVAALKCIPGVRILNPDHLFLDYTKSPKRHLFALDGYHVSRTHGINQMAKIIRKALQAEYGPSVLSAFHDHQGKYKVVQCSACLAKGHTTGACQHYCCPRPNRRQ
ncbi:uncharacterized protein LOC142587371 [Dermacentor variabilis]|uniref:uncharacterized protein LOC142587371 n=1 Tax=Dermacentor variabilis TaxID=34621 RepID=UPI003F5C4F75